ncbi:MAG: rhomboid family intramembrane serine protease [Bacteroidetes bacterium]|jgi:membrane associated rhomboid family serine protease|nr:rhomboid family intramembrane serine protease [Bacteroidota bacterium]
MRYSYGGFGAIPPVVKNLLIINVIVLLAQNALPAMGIDLMDNFALYFFKSEKFNIIQYVTYMFMHGGFMHLFFNMFALWMFGRVLESVWGPKRFLLYYMITGVGAALVHTFVNFLQYESLRSQISPQNFQMVVEEGALLLQQGKVYSSEPLQKLQLLLNTPTVGASGAVFGILLAFGMLFPNTQLMLLFPPIPIKAKYFVILYGGLELYLGLSQPGSNIAHFAHLGGMLFGFILIKYWQKNTTTFY